MWLYNLIQKKRVFIYSSYTLFMFLAILSLWRMLQGYSFMQLSSLFAPVFYAFLVVLALLLLFKPAHFVFVYGLTMGSTLLITTIFLQLSGWVWTEEVIVAYILLIAISSTLILFIFTRHEEVIRAVGVSILYSVLFFSLLLVAQLYSPLLSQLMLILIVGQVVTYVLSILFLPWIRIVPRFSSKRMAPIASVKKESIEKKEFKKSALRLSIYILLVLLSWYYVQIKIVHLGWTMVWVFSLFLLAALFNSMKSSVIIHFVLLYIGIALVGILYVAPLEAHVEVIMGTLILMGVGIHQMIIWMFSGYNGKSTYLLTYCSFLAAPVPLLLDIARLSDSQWMIITVLIGFFVVNSLSANYLPFFKRVFFSEKRRSNRPLHNSYSDSTDAPSSDKKEQVDDSYISIGIRERDLTRRYGQWLRKKELKLHEDFSKNHD